MQNNDSRSDTQRHCKCASVFHNFLMLLTYGIAIWLSFVFLSIPDAQLNTITLITSGAILATFGSAISAIAATWTSDLQERIHFNIDILFREILKDINPWRRWPFLERTDSHILPNGSTLRFELNNPKIPFNLKSCTVEIEVPSMVDDLYDLSVCNNLSKASRHRTEALMSYTDKGAKELMHSYGMSSYEALMAYLCLHDVWKSALKFRVARYLLHFGSALTIAGSLLTIAMLTVK